MDENDIEWVATMSDLAFSSTVFMTELLVPLLSTRRLVFGPQSRASFNATSSTDADTSTQWHADGAQASHSDTDTMNPQRVKRGGQVAEDVWCELGGRSAGRQCV
jgi:hypothetical protein